MAGVGNTLPFDDSSFVGEYTPFLPDTKAVLDIHIGLAKALGLPGVGDNALLNSSGNPVGQHLHRGWDWAKAILQNIAASAQAEHPGITSREILSRGGVFDNPGDEYTGGLLDLPVWQHYSHFRRPRCPYQGFGDR